MNHLKDLREAGRKKLWCELSAEEKCERLRGEVKKLQVVVSSTIELLEKHVRHNHHPTNGSLLLPMDARVLFRLPGVFHHQALAGQSQADRDDAEGKVLF